MVERNELRQLHERVGSSELSPTSGVVDVLRGSISEPIKTISQKPGQAGQEVEVCIVKEGSGMFGLSDWRDNKEWSGIFNHSLLTARYSVYFAQELAKAGYETHPQTILDAMIVSHAGRRAWDEANWYPQAAPDAQEKTRIPNEHLGLRLIHGKVPADTFALVASLAHNPEGFASDSKAHKSLDHKIAQYVDHRTSQIYEPLNTRMGDFLLNNFFDKNEITDSKRNKVYKKLGQIIENRRDFLLGQPGGIISLHEADSIARPDSPKLKRIDLMKLILQDAETEAALIMTNINPERIDGITVPKPNWEKKLRAEYVSAAQDEIFKRIESSIARDRISDIWFDFSPSTWWGREAMIQWNAEQF